MYNLKLPTYPVTLRADEDPKYTGCANQDGFTKLELASLMIAQGMLSAGVGSNIIMGDQSYSLDVAAVKIAKAVLEEANK